MSEQQNEKLGTEVKLNLNITTPRGLKFVEEADMVVMRCIDGNLGVMPGHAPVTAILGDGTLRIVNNGIEKKLAVFGGIVEIKNNVVNVFSTIAQRFEEIDLERAKEDLEKARAAIQENQEEMQFQNLRALMYRSLVRIEVASYMEDADYFNEDDDV